MLLLNNMFFNEVLMIPYQQFLILLSFMRTFFETKKLLNIYSICFRRSVNINRFLKKRSC